MSDNNTATPVTTTEPVLTIQERLAARRKDPAIRVVADEVLGDVRMRRLTAGRGYAIVSEYGDDTAMQMVVECLLDESDKPVYSDIDALRREDMPLVLSLVETCNRLNMTDVKAAVKK